MYLHQKKKKKVQYYKQSQFSINRYVSLHTLELLYYIYIYEIS